MLGFAILVCLATANAYVWPSPQLDELEALGFDQDGHSSRGIAGAIQRRRLDTAYHDMATHNVMDGTGGLDASIRFAEEQARPENAGDGVGNTIAVLLGQSNRYVSIADALVVGAHIAIENCARPEIAFRGGRADAGEPNARGVPQPQEELQIHIANFARQGFTQTEMIGLIACGHTFGGVQHEPFPDIVPELNDPDSTESVAHFDSTFVHFDNNIATEYIAGTTQNPLVVGFNDTTNSDKRIFGSDGNVTMQGFAKSPELYALTCANLFARILDTVPSGVQLTEVITPLAVKPSKLQFTLDGDILKFSGEVRFWDMTEDADRTVRLLWDDHVGGTNNITLPFAGEMSRSSLDARAGITKMRFAVDNELEDQSGVGFLVNDGVVFSETSCATSLDPVAGRFDVAVRNGLNPTRVYLEEATRDSVSRPILVETQLSPPTQPVAAETAYAIWSIDLDNPFASYTVAAEVDGAKIVTNGAYSIFEFPLAQTEARPKRIHLILGI
ncbi:heme peroxidase [Mycena latifolia]|nr:heme peroxidase [Mycena latifolia]